MSKSKANTLLQHLHKELSKWWSGKNAGFTATKAYSICREIVREADENEQIPRKESDD